MYLHENNVILTKTCCASCVEESVQQQCISFSLGVAVKSSSKISVGIYMTTLLTLPTKRILFVYVFSKMEAIIEILRCFGNCSTIVRKCWKGYGFNAGPCGKSLALENPAIKSY